MRKDFDVQRWLSWGSAKGRPLCFVPGPRVVERGGFAPPNPPRIPRPGVTGRLRSGRGIQVGSTGIVGRGSRVVRKLNRAWRPAALRRAPWGPPTAKTRGPSPRGMNTCEPPANGGAVAEAPWLPPLGRSEPMLLGRPESNLNARPPCIVVGGRLAPVERARGGRALSVCPPPPPPSSLLALRMGPSLQSGPGWMRAFRWSARKMGGALRSAPKNRARPSSPRCWGRQPRPVCQAFAIPEGRSTSSRLKTPRGEGIPPLASPSLFSISPGCRR